MKQSEETKLSDASDAMKDVDAVKRIVTVIKERKINPFTYDGEELVSISTGQVTCSTDIIIDKEIGLNVPNKCEICRLPKLEPVLLKPFIQCIQALFSLLRRLRLHMIMRAQ